MKRILSSILAVTLLVFSATCCLAATPALIHAEKYHDEIDVTRYWVSEKLDGVRAYWDGKQLLSRQGNRFHAPAWFLNNFPARALDGELWIARNTFEQVVSTVRKSTPVDTEWRAVGYYLFELPNADGNFTQRIAQMQEIVAIADNPHLRTVEQFRLGSREALLTKLDEIVAAGGEGLMLHVQDADYHAGRSDALLKLKPYQDAEATVIEHLPGKGRHKGRLGSLLVETSEGIRFRLGTGFTDSQRENPPPIGSTVTYKYFGVSRKGVPKFASFLRIRQTD